MIRYFIIAICLFTFIGCKQKEKIQYEKILVMDCAGRFHAECKVWVWAEANVLEKHENMWLIDKDGTKEWLDIETQVWRKL